MKLRQILKNLPIKDTRGSKEVEITGICSDSRYAAPGNLFIAKKGRNFDGAMFIPEAVSAGAAAVVSDIYDPFLGKITQIIHPAPAEIEADIAARYYKFPSKELFMVGITGTNGKTTAAYLIRHLLKESGLLGTNEYLIGGNRIAAARTTPDNVSIQKYLREMALAGQKSACMEVSSHALAQNRVANIDFDCAVFTNLSRDHLDYHGDMEKYFLAKRKLFENLGRDKVAIINADDSRAKELIKSAPCRVLTYGTAREAGLRAENILVSSEGLSFEAVYRERRFKIKSFLIGRFNVYNLLAAAAVGLSLKMEPEKIKRRLSAFKGAAGRLERISNLRGLSVFVDYAHTPDALKNVLLALRELTRGKVILVFGCGGGRDRGKRVQMGKIAERYADRVILTSDNSRGEDTNEIIREIFSGFSFSKYCMVKNCRRSAIRMAIGLAERGDTVLIAGKGHETTQEWANSVEPFDDRQVAKEVLSDVL